MSRWLPERWQPTRLSLGMAAQEQVLVWTDGEVRIKRFVGPPDALPEAFGRFLDEEPALARLCRRTPLQVTLAEDLLRWWLVNAPIGTASLSELASFARFRHDEIFGSTLDDWVLQARWSSQQASVCCATPQAALDSVQALSRSFGVRVGDVVPATQRLLERWGRQPWPEVLVCLVCDDRAVMWWFDAGRPVRLRALRLPASEAGVVLASELSRGQAALPPRSGIAVAGPTEPVVVLGASRQRWPGLDALPNGQPPRQFGLRPAAADQVCGELAAAGQAAHLGLVKGDAYELMARH